MYVCSIPSSSGRVATKSFDFNKYVSNISKTVEKTAAKSPVNNPKAVALEGRIISMFLLIFWSNISEKYAAIGIIRQHPKLFRPGIVVITEAPKPHTKAGSKRFK